MFEVVRHANSLLGVRVLDAIIFETGDDMCGVVLAKIVANNYTKMWVILAHDSAQAVEKRVRPLSRRNQYVKYFI